MADNNNQEIQFESVDHFFEEKLKTFEFNKIEDSVLFLCYLFAGCEELKWEMALKDNKIVFTNNIVSLCYDSGKHQSTQELIDMLQNKEDGNYKKLFKDSSGEFTFSGIKRTCVLPCLHSNCPKCILALLLWLAQKGKLEEYLAKRTSPVGFFEFKWGPKDGVKYVTAEMFEIAMMCVDNGAIRLLPFLDEKGKVVFKIAIDCDKMVSPSVAKAALDALPKPIAFNDYTTLRRLLGRELHDGACGALTCRNEQCPIHIAGYIQYMKMVGKWDEIEADRKWYEEHKEEVEQKAKEKYEKELNELYKNKLSKNAVAKFDALHNKIENLDILVNNVASKYASNLYCAIELEEGIDKEPIIKAITDALFENGHLKDKEGKRIKNERHTLVKLMGKDPYTAVSLNKNTLYIIEEIDEFIFQNEGDRGTARRAKRAISKTFASPEKGVFVIFIGYQSELQMLFSFDNKMKYLYDNMKIVVKELTNDELFELYLSKLDSIVADAVRADRDEYKSQFDEFVVNNRHVIPFKNAELATFAAQYANAKGEFALPPSVYKKQTLDESLDSVIGLDSVKDKMKELEKYALFLNKAKSMNLKMPSQNLHMIFTGNPGSGKTMMARIMVQMLYDIGLIKHNKLIEVERKDLIAQYVGQTAPKVTEVINKSVGGVLFIDEAYSLCSGRGSSHDYGAEAIATLIKAMEDRKDELVIIFAGYKDEMKQFVDSNPGIKSRIGYTFHFPDYNADELIEILKAKLSKSGFEMNEKAVEEARKIAKIYMKRKNFGNGRFVDKLMQEIFIKHSQNTDGQLNEITAGDLPTIEELANESTEKLDYKIGFENIIGMTKLKEQVAEFASYVQFQKRAENSGLQLPKTSMHMIFTGNPGTGKTTVARLIARMLFDMDIIHENKLVEVDRKDLIAEYIGQTAPKTMEVVDKAMGGVLFIDEAYSLCSGRGNDYGSEAIATLIKAMEDHKDDLIVVFAGYKNEMKQFVDMNPGIASRIGYTFHFEDYSPEELRDIYNLKMTKTGFEVSPEAEEKVLEICRYFHRVENLGNGRFVDKLVQETIMNHAKANKDNMTLIEADVVPSIEDVTKSLSTTTRIMDASKITPDSLQKTAVHEIGHAYVRYKLYKDPGIVKITINAEGVGTLGYVEHKGHETLTQSRQMLLNEIAVSLAGMASEEIFKGKFENGNSSDLRHATDVALRMVTHYGMSDLGLVYIEEPDLAEGTIYGAVNKILMEALGIAKKILTDNKAEVVKLTNILLTKKEMTGEQFMEHVKK